MKVITSVQEMTDTTRRLRRAGKTVVLVPTMGALHQGHLELVRVAAKEGDHVIVSVFVNPTQFGPGEDYQAYPRTLAGDSDKLEEMGLVDTVFAPSSDEMYPHGEPLTWVEVDQISEHLCGSTREGHFRGVATVVTKLFNICRPHKAVFGLKDAQQFFLLKRLVFDLNLDVDLVGVPTVREQDGLALSSRNKYLTDRERPQAVVLNGAARAAKTSILEGERDGRRIKELMQSILERADLGRVDYVELVDSVDFQPVDLLSPGQTVVAAVAVHFGQARLIDNAIIDVP